MAPITITNLKTILTAPAGIRLVVVKLEMSEPGLYGLGCATFTQRHHAVAATLDKHLKPFVIGKEVQRIEDLW
jgi:mannonate dehydratase